MYQDPYAVKALVQHEYDTNHLNIWLTFPEPMNQKHKPLDTVWIVDVDGVIKAVTSSAWQDANTLLLVVGSIGSKPVRVQVEFDGPDSYLETTWFKNWEPWGYILSEDIGRLVEIDPVAMAYLDQAVKVASSPEFKDLTINPSAAYPYKITKWAGATAQLALAQQISGQNLQLRLMTKDGDGTDALYLIMASKGNLADNNTNTNYLLIGIDANGPFYRINTGGAGTAAALLPLRLFASAYNTQLILNTDGSISMYSTLDVGTGFKVGGTSAVADGQYTVGMRLTALGTDGKITVKGGIITAIQSAT